MRALPAIVMLALTAGTASAQTRLQLRWEVVEEPVPGPNGRDAARVAFVLTNRDTAPLPRDGWAIYFNAMRRSLPARALPGGVTFETMQGDFHRMVPTPAFQGLAPGQTARIEYMTSGLVGNRSFLPAGPYIVFDREPGKGHAIGDYDASPPRPAAVAAAGRAEAVYAANEPVREMALAELPPVFPTPLRFTTRDGGLRLDAMPAVSAPPELAAEREQALDYLRRHLRTAAAAGRNAPVVRLAIGPVEGHDSPEAYELSVDSQGVLITGRSKAGVFYGLQSLRSMLPPAPGGGALSLPAIRIVDAPRFGYRGLHLDVARNFQSKSAVLRVLDLMARYKLNVLHFHLTEDEGWRLAIAGLPELTEVGARRGHTLDSASNLPPAYGSGPDTTTAFGSGFYSRSDYIEILRRAAALHIEVIPELEMPGHARAAIKAMEARYLARRDRNGSNEATQFLLSDAGDRSVYTSAQNFHDNVMNPALPSTYAFIEHVTADVVAMHREAGVPLRHLHMGGDEVPVGAWEQSPAALTYLKDHGLSSVNDLWFVFYRRVEDILKTHGLPLSGWEEIGLRRSREAEVVPNPEFADRGWRLYVWNTIRRGAEDLAYQLAGAGYGVVLCPVTNLYFDLAYTADPEERGLTWGGYVDADKPFRLLPFGTAALSERARANIVGLQGNLWSETLNGEGRLDEMLVPKLFGLAERAWAPDPEWARERDAARSARLYQDAWSVFANVLGRRELPRLALEQPGFRYRIPTPGLRAMDGGALANLQFPGFTLRYTIDGSEPTRSSPEVRGKIAARRVIRVAAFDGTGRRGLAAAIDVP